MCMCEGGGGGGGCRQKDRNQTTSFLLREFLSFFSWSVQLILQELVCNSELKKKNYPVFLCVKNVWSSL